MIAVAKEIMPETSIGVGRRPISYHLDYQPIVDRPSKFRITARARHFEELLKLQDEPRKLEELDRNISEGAEAVFAVDDETGKDLGILVHRLKTVTLRDRTLTLDMVALRVVESYAQGRGIGTRFTADTIRRYDEQGIDLDGFSGRTPNPNIIKAYRRIPDVGIIYPIDKLYPPDLREFMVAFLYPYIEGINFTTGRCIGVYPQGENRLFDPLDPNDLEGNAVRDRMVKPEKEGGLGIDLQAGDGVRYLALRRKASRGRSRWATLPSDLPQAA